MSEIQVHGALFVGPFKGYRGRAEYDADVGAFHGEVTETKNVITFVGNTPLEVTAAFKESIDDYLALCESRGESPDKPYSGNFVVRVSPELHHDVAVAAERMGKSLNKYVSDALLASITKPLTIPAPGPETQHFTFDMTSLISQVAPASVVGTFIRKPIFIDSVDFKPLDIGYGGRLSDLPARKQIVRKTGTTD